MRSGRSEAGMGMCSPNCIDIGLRERCWCVRKASHGTCATAISATSTMTKSSPSVCFESVDTTLHDSVQDSQSRGWDESVSTGASSRVSQGQSPGHLSGASCDFSCPGIPSVQHSTRVPARQSVGIPTKLQTTAMSARIRMITVYATPSRASTTFSLIAVSAW